VVFLFVYFSFYVSKYLDFFEISRLLAANIRSIGDAEPICSKIVEN